MCIQIVWILFYKLFLFSLLYFFLSFLLCYAFFWNMPYALFLHLYFNIVINHFPSIGHVLFAYDIYELFKKTTEEEALPQETNLLNGVVNP